MTTIDDEPDPPNGFYQFSGRSPDGTGNAWFVVAKDGIIGYFAENHNRHKELEGLFVPEVVKNPTGIWTGLSRPGKRDAYCYAGLPTGRFIGDMTIQVPSMNARVFLVYICERRAKSGQLIVTDWELVACDRDRKEFPEGYDHRYGRKLWPAD